jgi:hypothetical protein
MELGILVRAHPTLRATYYLLILARGVLTILRSITVSVHDGQLVC